MGTFDEQLRREQERVAKERDARDATAAAGGSADADAGVEQNVERHVSRLRQKAATRRICSLDRFSRIAVACSAAFRISRSPLSLLRMSAAST